MIWPRLIRTDIGDGRTTLMTQAELDRINHGVDHQAAEFALFDMSMYHEWELANCRCDELCSCDPTPAEIREWAANQKGMRE